MSQNPPLSLESSRVIHALRQPLNFNLMAPIQPAVPRASMAPAIVTRNPSPPRKALSAVAAPTELDAVTKTPTRWTCDLNGVAVYVYSDVNGVQYIATERQKGFRGAFPDDRLRPFEIDINTLVNEAGEPIKTTLSSVREAFPVPSYHRHFIRVSDLRYILLNVCTAFGTDEVDKLLEDFAADIRRAEQGIEKLKVPRRRRTVEKKRDRSSDEDEQEGKSDESVSKKSATDERRITDEKLEKLSEMLVTSMTAMTTKLENMEQRLNQTTLMVSAGQHFGIDIVSKDPSADELATFKGLPAAVKKYLMTQYVKGPEWQAMKKALEDSTRADTERDVKQAFNATAKAEIEKVKAQARADFEQTEAPKLREEFWNSLKSQVLGTLSKGNP